MNPDSETVKEWLKFADDDFGFATISLQIDNYFYQICFHYQQAAEKYFKAYIMDNNLEFRKIHDLIELLEICKTKETGIDILRESCVFLNRFYIESRYPMNLPEDFTRSDADAAYKHCLIIQGYIKKLLEQNQS
jgi:HEPN domain-containing protein